MIDVSVIIAAKDCEKWLPETVSSLIDQTFTDWNCIISVNGSSDGTEDFAKSIDDLRFRVITSNIANKSLAVNRAIISVESEWISILDADDLWHKDKLLRQVNFLRDNKVDILGTQMLYIDESGSEILSSPTLPTSHDECVAWLDQRLNPIANSSVIYRRDLHDRVGFYDPEKFAVEDYDLWMRSKRVKATFFNLNERMMNHRLHSSSNFNSSKKQQIYKSIVDEIDNFMKERQ